MAELNQFLRLRLGRTDYLLPSEASVSIEKREHLNLADGDGERVAAWRTVGAERWPALRLNGELQPVGAGDWQRAVFVEGSPHPLGLIADEIQLLPRTEVQVAPFTPLGPAPTSEGHLFAGAWSRDDRFLLVFAPKALAAYLAMLWGGAQ